MVAYGNLLLILQYIWSFEKLDGVAGLFLKSEVPFPELSSKVSPSRCSRAIVYCHVFYIIISSSAFFWVGLFNGCLVTSLPCLYELFSSQISAVFCFSSNFMARKG